jgi:hypothetical protein
MWSRSLAGFAALLIATALLLAACGGGDSSKDAKAKRPAGADAGAELGDEKDIARPKLTGPRAFSPKVVGPLRVGPTATFAVATKQLGPPDVAGPGDADPSLCAATWIDLGLTLLFDTSNAGECGGTGSVVAAYATSGDWLTGPDGLEVGDEEAAITRAHARAKRVQLPAVVQRTIGATEGWLLQPSLYAVVRDGKVSALVYSSGRG